MNIFNVIGEKQRTERGLLRGQGYRAKEEAGIGKI